MKKKNRKLSSLITAKILIFSSVVTFVLTGIQLYFDYEARKTNTSYFISKVLQTGSSSLAHNLWYVNLPALTNQLQSTLNLNDIASLKLLDLDQKEIFYKKKEDIKSVLSTETIDVIYFDSVNDEKNKLGTLEVVVTSDNIIKEILDKIIFVLINQFIKTIIVSGFIIWLVRTNVTDRLAKLLDSVLPFESISSQKADETRKNLDSFKTQNSRHDDEISTFRNFLSNILEKQWEYITHIRAMNLGLEDTVEKRTQEINYKNRSMSMILSNIQQGIFMIDPDLKIEPEYSDHTKEILNEKDLNGRDVMTVFVTKTSLSENDKNQIYSSLLSSFGQPFVFNLNKHNLPGEMVLRDKETEKHLEVSWEPIVVNNDIAQIMVSVRDISEIRRYRLEAIEKDREGKKILEIIESGYENFRENINAFKHYCRSSIQILDAGKSEFTREELQEIFRNIHTIKGNSRSLQFEELTECAHVAEQAYHDILTRKTDPVPVNKDALLKDLKTIRLVINSYQQLYDEKLSGKIKSGHDDAKNQLIGTLIPLVDDALCDATHCEKNLESIKKILQSESHRSLRATLRPMIQSLAGYAAELGKQTPVVSWGEEEIWLPNEHVKLISDIFEHLIRNSLDHGFQRSDSSGKSAFQHHNVLYFQVRYQSDHMTISYYDSGRGLNIEALKERFTDTVEDSEEQLADLIFRPGVSTANALTHISGRGIGMDAVRSFLSRVGGNIRVVFTETSNQNGYRKFRFELVLPFSVPQFLHHSPVKTEPGIS